MLTKPYWEEVLDVMLEKIEHNLQLGEVIRVLDAKQNQNRCVRIQNV
jgi:hypothetical protein